MTAQYESEAVYHSIREDLEAQGVIFLDMDSGLREFPDLVKEYFCSVIPYQEQQVLRVEHRSLVWRVFHLRSQGS